MEALLIQEFAKLHVRFDRIEGRLDRLEFRMDGLEKEVKDNSKKIESLEVSVKDNTKKIESLEVSVKDNTKRITSLEFAVKDNGEKIDVLKEVASEAFGASQDFRKWAKRVDQRFAKVMSELKINREQVWKVVQRVEEQGRDIHLLKKVAQIL